MNLSRLTDQQLFTETTAAIWRAAAGEAQGGHAPSYDHAMQLREESARRHLAAGHDQRCPASIYDRAYEQAIADLAHRTAEPSTCSCGKDTNR